MGSYTRNNDDDDDDDDIQQMLVLTNIIPVSTKNNHEDIYQYIRMNNSDDGLG